MRTVLVLMASLLLSSQALAGACFIDGVKINSCQGSDCCEGEWVPGNGNGGNSVVDIDITGTLDNTNTNTNTNTLDNSNTTTIGDTTATGGNVYIGGGYGEEGEGGDTLSPTATSDSSTTIGDTTLNNDSTSVSGANASTGDQITNVDNTDNSYNGGNTLIVGGGQGECYEGECEGGSGTLNSNAENNVDIDNSSSATGGEGGNATIEGGAVVVENNITVEGGSDVPTANSQTVEGDETEINVDARTINEATSMPVNSAAPSFSGICNSGAAGSGSKISLSFAVTNDVCQCLMIADAYMAMGDIEEAHTWVEAAARHAKWKGGVGYIRHLVTLGIL